MFSAIGYTAPESTLDFAVPCLRLDSEYKDFSAVVAEILLEAGIPHGNELTEKCTTFFVESFS